MNLAKIPEFISLFEEFKKTKDYAFRIRQSDFTKIAKQIIEETLKNEPLTNEHLTGLIQMLKLDTSNQSFNKYIIQNIQDAGARAKISKEKSELGYNGYTGAGRAAIRDLNSNQLSEVKEFLSGAFDVKTITEAKTLTDKFDVLNVPELKQGIYSPWLHYINPEIFPIINSSHYDLMRWFQMNNKYSSCIDDYAELLKVTGETHLGTIDFFAYHFKLDSSKRLKAEKRVESNEDLAERLLRENADNATILESFRRAYKNKKNITDENYIKSRVEIYMNIARRRANLVPSESFNEPKVKYWLYSPGENAQMWEEFYKKGIMGISGRLGDLNNYKSKEEIVLKLQEIENTSSSKKNDATAHFEFKEAISIGDFVIVKKGRGELLGYGEVKSEYRYDSSLDPYQSIRDVNWIKKGNWETDHVLALKALTDITKYPTEHPDYEFYYERLLGLMNGINGGTKVKYPLNTIFYGPPGTGKTYNTILRAAQIVKNGIVSDYSEAMRIFNENLGDRIEFITFHQNYSYEDFIQGLRPDVECDGNLSFERKDGVFKRIADRALNNLLTSAKAPEEISKSISFDTALEKFKDYILENEEHTNINDTVNIIKVENDAFRYKGKNWGPKYGWKMKFSDLKEFYEQGVKNRQDIKKLKNITGLAKQDASYFIKVYEKILSYLTEIKVVEVKKQNYVIIIDEINRANISRVFGELITLVEIDKRSNGSIPLKCTLPSGQEFIVPSNLYIIGTMNTADKSIALLDIALRRRFEFEAMYPLYEIDNCEIYDVDILEKINMSIKKLKGHDFQVGHSYFMGDNLDLLERMNKKVIPLLLEYFMNDEKEVKGILSNAGLSIDQDSWPLKINGLL